MRFLGIVKFVNYKSKFGFIKVIDTGEEIYFSTIGIQDLLQNNDSVSFEINQAPKGPIAINIKKNESLI